MIPACGASLHRRCPPNHQRPRCGFGDCARRHGGGHAIDIGRVIATRCQSSERDLVGSARIQRECAGATRCPRLAGRRAAGEDCRGRAGKEIGERHFVTPHAIETGADIACRFTPVQDETASAGRRESLTYRSSALKERIEFAVGSFCRANPKHGTTAMSASQSAACAALRGPS